MTATVRSHDTPPVARTFASKPRRYVVVRTATSISPVKLMHLRRLSLMVLSVVAASRAAGQSLDLTVNQTGLSIGDSRFVRGVRLNFRDRRMERVIGVNATLWSPYNDARGGVVQGLALGLPVTGARRIEGAGIGILGIGTDGDFRGIGVGGIGIGAGGDARGIMLGGFGVGSGGNVSGLTIGGFGAGAGGDIRGITIGGFGAGSGGSIEGITIGGFGAGAAGGIRGLTIGGFGAGTGGDMTGITIGGFGAGAGGSVRGLTIGGFGAGAGGDITGITIGGFGAGAGGTMRGLAIGGFGAGAPRIRGIVLSGIAAGGHDVYAGVLSPLYFKIESERDGPMGRMTGVSVSSFNHIKGEQFGLSVGLLNYAWELHGWQVGVLNYARSNPPGLQLLPLFNKRWR